MVKPKDFSVSHGIHTNSGTHPASYPMGTGGSFLGVKQAGHNAHHSPLSGAKVKKVWRYISILPLIFNYGA
jgi:hypothetical protein